ncbi:MAG: hypothetical protein B6D61_12715 [Bacteroidetes bacterium 4484_249]|nr:MAG: hypothetical protein B6D61_12715 [Bacteroidetes bacterium 4484_249]
MRIANPLYDKTFKYLMENNRIAKKVISVLLDQEVEELTLGQQETLVADDKRGFTLFRLDFKAIIKEPDGTRKKVLLELQKSKFPIDIQRFRNYLGTNYIRIDSNIDADNYANDNNEIYPIITIYILGYSLDDLPYLAVTVNREVINSINKEIIKVKSFFIEHLTHASHIIQVRRLPEQRRTRLEKFLTLFNQAWVADKNYILDLQDIPEEFKDVAKYLEGPAMDEKFRRQLEAEEEIDKIFDIQEAKFLKQIEEIRQREEEAKQREIAMAMKLVRQMKKAGHSIDEIIEETGLTKQEIEDMK